MDLEMEIKREKIIKNNLEIPCVTFKPPRSRGAAVFVHGYGGMKEETIGLAWRIAEKGYTTGAIDLRGHGENKHELDKNILKDLETAVSHFKSYGNVTAIGHSLGGRLSLLSNADYAIGISPALNKTFSPQTIKLLEENRDYRVQKSNYDVFKILNDLPIFQFDKNKSLVIYGSRDIPEIMSKCIKLNLEGFEVIKIDKALHNDIFLYEPTFKTVARKLNTWY